MIGMDVRVLRIKVWVLPAVLYAHVIELLVATEG